MWYENGGWCSLSNHIQNALSFPTYWIMHIHYNKIQRVQENICMYLHCFTVQVCQGGECVHSDHGLDLPGKTDNIPDQAGKIQCTHKIKTKSCILLNITGTLIFTRSENATSTCDRFLICKTNL